MSNLANTTQNDVSLLDSLAAQAQMFVQNARMNLLQLGRVLTEARPLVPHGEWESWVKTNTDMSKRAAEQYMQAYREFGLNPQIAALGTTKTLKLLPLSEQEREQLMSEHDVSSMSTRQLEDAIRQQRSKLEKEAMEKAQSEIDREKEARIAAEQKNRQIEEEKQGYKLQIEELKKGITDNSGLQDKIERLQKEINERDEIIQEQQEDYNRAQNELLNVKSAIAKGDAERIPSDQFTPEAFASAVRAFIGTCARMPHMAMTFSDMEEDAKEQYDELLRTIEGWARDSRKALDTVIVDHAVFTMEGGVIGCE